MSFVQLKPKKPTPTRSIRYRCCCRAASSFARAALYSACSRSFSAWMRARSSALKFAVNFSRICSGSGITYDMER